MNESMINALRGEIRELEGAVELARQKIKKKTAELAAAICPLSIGDEVVLKGYTYRGRRGIVYAVRPKPNYNSGWTWSALATVLKNDGSPSMLSAEFGENQFERVEKCENCD